MSIKNSKQKPLLALLFMPLILIYVAVALVVTLPYRFLKFVFHLVVGSFRHSRVILVYSDSSKWKSQVESEILPILPQDSLVFNISKSGSKQNFDYRQYALKAIIWNNHFQ